MCEAGQGQGGALMPRYRVTVAGKSYDEMADLVREHRLNLAGHTAKKKGRRWATDAFADDEQIARLRNAGYAVDVHEDVQEAGAARQREVRSAAARALVADAGHYLNVDDVEQSLADAAAGPNAAFTQLIALPHKTWEGRDCH